MIAELLARGKRARSGAPWVRKFGKLSIRENLVMTHPRRPRGGQSGREKRRDESFQVRAKEPLGTDS